MSAPLTRDEQIELMRTAEEVYENRMAKWLNDPTIREVVSHPAPGQDKKRQYVSTDLLVSCG